MCACAPKACAPVASAPLPSEACPGAWARVWVQTLWVCASGWLHGLRLAVAVHWCLLRCYLAVQALLVGVLCLA